MNATEQTRVELSHWRTQTPRTIRDAEIDMDCAQWADGIDRWAVGALSATGWLGVAIVVVWLIVGGLIDRGFFN